MNERRIVAIIVVDDDKAIEEDIGTLDYLEEEFSYLQEMGSGIYIEDARVIDDEDPYDADTIEMVNKIFLTIMNEVINMKELCVDMTFYMEMKDGETNEEAKKRFNKEFIMENMTTECAIQVYEMRVEEN